MTVVEVAPGESVTFRGHYYSEGAILTVPTGLAYSWERQGVASIVGPY